MLKNKFLKSFLRVALVSCLLVGVSVQPLGARKALSSGIVLPGAPRGLAQRSSRLAFKIFVGAGLGMLLEVVNPLPGRPYFSSKEKQDKIYQPLRPYPVIGLFAGLAIGLWQWGGDSAKHCLALFNSLYNAFLLNPVLEKDMTLAALINRSVMSDIQSYWAMVRVVDVLDEAIKDLVEVLTFGQMLRESKLIQGLGDAEFESLLSKISSLHGLLQMARSRRDSAMNHPSYRLQKEFYKRYGMLKHQQKNSADMFELLWNDWCVEQLAQGNRVEDTPSIQSPVSDMSECSLCGLMVLQSKRYTTRCACAPGRHFYHHECVARALKHNKNECLRCGYPATVHSAFSSTVGEGPMYGPPVQDAVAAKRPHSRYRCTLCRGAILRNKAYKTSCACPVDTFFYHHECLKTHLVSSHNCPVCNTVEPIVLSDFNDGFAPAEQPVAAVPVPRVIVPTAPAVDVLNTCALCSGKIINNKRYKTQCNCGTGRYYYHHLCIADTLKKTGNKCPKCSHENTTVHSAF